MNIFFSIIVMILLLFGIQYGIKEGLRALDRHENKS